MDVKALFTVALRQQLNCTNRLLCW